MNQYIPLLVLFVILSSCQPTNNRSDQIDKTPSETTMHLKYADGFSVSYEEHAKWVEVKYPYQGASKGHRYLLVDKGFPAPPHDPGVIVIPIPLENIICSSTTHLPFLDYLNESEKLIGFPTLDYVCSPKIRKLIDEGKVKELGVDKGMNIELLAALQPEMVMGYTISGNYGQFKKIEELGIPVVINAEYLEKHPLGRAEWIKFMALFFNKEHEADSIFKQIELNYLESKKLVDANVQSFSVMSGIMYGDAWFLPGGENYAARLFNDAGYRYIWNNNTSNGFLKLSFETVYAKAYHADYWIGVGAFETLQQLKDADQRYADFKAFKERQVYTYEAKKGPKGGSEFMELGYLRPDIILNDLIKISNPSLLPNYTLYFHKKLE